MCGVIVSPRSPLKYRDNLAADPRINNEYRYDLDLGEGGKGEKRERGG